MKRVITILCCAAIIIGVFCLVPNLTESVEAKNNNNEIVGTWVYWNGSRIVRSLQFTETGECIIWDESANAKMWKTYNFTYKDNTLTIDGTDYKCSLVENGLFIHNIDGSGYVRVFERA